MPLPNVFQYDDPVLTEDARRTRLMNGIRAQARELVNQRSQTPTGDLEKAYLFLEDLLLNPGLLSTQANIVRGFQVILRDLNATQKHSPKYGVKVATYHQEIHLLDSSETYRLDYPRTTLLQLQKLTPIDFGWQQLDMEAEKALFEPLWEIVRETGGERL